MHSREKYTVKLKKKSEQKISEASACALLHFLIMRKPGFPIFGNACLSVGVADLNLLHGNTVYISSNHMLYIKVYSR